VRRQQFGDFTQSRGRVLDERYQAGDSAGLSCLSALHQIGNGELSTSGTPADWLLR